MITLALFLIVGIAALVVILALIYWYIKDQKDNGIW